MTFLPKHSPLVTQAPSLFRYQEEEEEEEEEVPWPRAASCSSSFRFKSILGRGMSYSFPSVMNDSTKPPIPETCLSCRRFTFAKHEPWELPDKSNIKSKDSEWYFFCPRDFKYLNGSRSNRRTKLGFWKPTGKSLKIRSKGTKKVIGIRKTLVFYTKASPKSIRTGWIMHEYEYISDLSLSNQKKPDEKTNKGEPNHQMVSISDPEAAPNCIIEGERGSSMEMPSKFINHSTRDKEAYIPAPDEGERNSPTAMHWCLENSNPWETTEEGCLRSSVVSTENSPTDAWLPELLELIPRIWEKLKASILDVENNLPAPLQPAASEKISLRNGVDAPVST
ncbi:putative proteinC DOMAIN-CONTAINING PROTEIN 82-RELATED [Salix viminalis]|uniref:NAC domain-containing protein n=1 Tax=Salix viminalis TaxID=40686 RepID=A0A9Q0NSH9_SALVM|nr:putative proteinC DOMAIN-CONTAINING PROTEIN 82-RELATED [Salix viminalis]